MILVVAATEPELQGARGARTLACGVGPVEAAARTAAELAVSGADAVLHVGVAGARRHRTLAPAAIVVGTEARYCDLPASLPPSWAPHTVAASASLVAAVRRVVPDAVATSIGTSARVGGTSGCDVEAMEGFGVLRAAQLAGVPAVEVRAIANEIEEPDRARWHFEVAFDAITSVTPRLVEALLPCAS